MRTLVDIPDDDIDKLDALAVRHNCSRAAAIREAIRRYLIHTHSNDWIERGYGLWADREDVADGLVYQRALRAEPPANG